MKWDNDHWVNLTRLVAFLLMIQCHFLYTFAGSGGWLILPVGVGTCAIPVFCWSVVRGMELTKCRWKYLARLLGVGLCSEWFYLMSVGEHSYVINPVLALLFGGICIYVFTWIPVAGFGVLLMGVLFGDWFPWQSSLLIFLWWILREDP